MANYTVFLRNCATKKTYSFKAEDMGGKMYYSFSLPDYAEIVDAIGEGEGEYFVCPEGAEGLEGAEVLDRGVAQVGKIERQIDSYNTEKTYRQYEG